MLTSMPNSLVSTSVEGPRLQLVRLLNEYGHGLSIPFLAYSLNQRAIDIEALIEPLVHQGVIVKHDDIVDLTDEGRRSYV